MRNHNNETTNQIIPQAIIDSIRFQNESNARVSRYLAEQNRIAQRRANFDKGLFAGTLCGVGAVIAYILGSL